MAFQSLYRKHRPQSFSALVGQEAVSTALRNAVREGRVGHAYLLSGPRGTGKTTTARLLAKAINCANRGADGEPCNDCPSCLEIAAGTSMDVVELDAASNRGISEMRSLLERVAYRSAGGARKVYIIDEVHMLTKEASTALLKTLEEPPDHVVFVLATTDPQMVSPTIRSRTQHFEFSLLPTDRLAGHLGEIARLEGVEAEPDALDLLARRAGGSARDALSLLDQALAYGDGCLVADQVAALLGGAPMVVRAAIVDALARGDVPDLLERLDALLGTGVEARQLADDLLRHLREIFLISSSKGRVRLETPEEERAQLLAQGEAMGAAAVVRALEALGEAAVEIRRAPDPRLVLEVALVRLARRDVSSLEALADRLGRLEQAVDELRGMLRTGSPAPSPATASVPAPVAASSASPSAVSFTASSSTTTSGRAGPQAALGALRGRTGASVPPPVDVRPMAPPPPPVPDTPAGEPDLDLDQVILAWPRALAGLKPRLKAMAKEAYPVRVEGATVVLGIPTRFQRVHLPAIQAEAATVSGALSAEVGRPVRLEVVLDDSRAASGDAAAGEDFEAGRGPGDVRADDMVAQLTDPEPGSRGGLDSPVGLVIETFGASVESETVRE